MDKKRSSANRRYSSFSTHDTFELCKRILRCLDSKVASETLDSIEGGRGAEVANRVFEYGRYGPGDVETFREDYTSYNLLRKFPALPGLDIDRTAVAIEKFLQCELECAESNKRITPFGFVQGGSNDLPLDMVFYHAQRKIASILGEFSWDNVVREVDFSGGASTRLPRSRSTLYDKVHGEIHTTRRLLPHLECFRSFRPGLFDGCKVVDGNKIITVPKDAKTDRVIAIEPDYNMFVQKGIGSIIRRRLKSHTKERIDLNDQTHNQLLARLASLGFGLATVDLSSASDTISTSLVSSLIPCEWFEAMDLCRSHEGTLPDGRKIIYEKFSSMGNGFTFELESLIFYALCHGIITTLGNGTEYVSVYGDDIVISSTMVGHLETVFAYAGFTVNIRKSFKSGYFYESCGKHYFNGSDVTPVYVDNVPQRIAQRIALANELILLSSRYGSGLYRDARLLDSINFIVRSLPPAYQKPKAPVSCKGNALIGDFDECLPSKAPRGFCGWSFMGLIETKKGTPEVCGAVAVRASLFTLEWRSYCAGTPSLSLRYPKFGKLRTKRITVSEWSYLGPYI